MRIAYGDLIGGLSGDMFAGAILDAGLPLKRLQSELKKIPSLRFRLRLSKKTVHAVRARRFQVICPGRESERSWKQIRSLISRSRLHPEVKENGIRIFRRLAEAEGKIHGIPADDVHFHEIGATDSIVDIMTAAIGCRELKIEKFHFSPIPMGRGITRSRHGPLPVPGPATLELVKNLPTFGIGLEAETVTPTGAAIISTLGDGFGAQPGMSVKAIGYGAGHNDFAAHPNLFRLLIGEDDRGAGHEEMLVIETNIDDMNPEFYDYVLERLFAAGARDVFMAPIQMKKNRPATLLTVICEPLRRGDIEKIVFQETSTIGVRCYPVSRTILKRASKKVKTRFGDVALKIVEQPDGSQRAIPEYDDLKRIAAAKKVSLKQLHDEIMRILPR
jgi:uncharacterized protein (TIGR00299 family) protein